MQEVNGHVDANSLHMVWLKQCAQRDSEEIWFRP